MCCIWLRGWLLNAQTGIDLAGGKQPSALQMMKLAAKSDFRATIKRVTEEMKKAGVDFGSKVRGKLFSPTECEPPCAGSNG